MSQEGQKRSNESGLDEYHSFNIRVVISADVNEL